MRFFSLIAITLFTICSCNQNTIIGNWESGESRWGETENVKRARGGVAFFQIDNYGYAGLGQNMNMNSSYEEYADDNGYMRDFWRFDPISGDWTKMADFPGDNRRDAVSFQLGDYGFVGLGKNEDGENTSTDRYNELKDFWRFTPPELAQNSIGQWDRVEMDYPGSARFGAMAFVLNEVAYVGTGDDGIDYLNDLYKFTIDASGVGTWERDPIRYIHKAKGVQHFTLNNEIYFVSGFDGDYLPNVWIFNGLEWRELMKLDDIDYEYNNVMRREGNSFAINGKGYIVAGNRGSTVTDVWEYDPTVDKWLEKSEFEANGRNGAAAFIFTDEAFIGLGDDGWNAYNDVTIFSPTDDYDVND